MNKLDLEDLQHPKIQVMVLNIKDGVQLQFKGEIDFVDPDPILGVFFDVLHEKVLEKEIQLVEVNLIGLMFINSSGFKSFIKWLIKIPKLPLEKRYQIKIIYNGKKKWLEPGLRVLKCLGPEFIKVEKK